MPSKSSEKKKQSSEQSEKRKSHDAERSARKRRKPPGPVMGLDLSMGGCGVSVIKGGKVLHLDRLQTGPVQATQGLKVAPRGLLASGGFLGSDEERITWLVKQIRKTRKKHGVCFVVIEGHAFGAKGRALTILHELHGVVKHYMNKDEIAFVTIPPTEVKKFATGDGRADKQTMIHACNKAGQADVKDSDRADAFWCGRFGWDKYADLVEE